MNRLTTIAAATLLGVLASAGSSLRAQGDVVPEAAPAPQVQNPFKPFDLAAFTAHVKSLGATEAQLQAFAAQTAELGAGRASDALLRLLNAGYDAAMKATEAADPAAAVQLAKVLADSRDPVLQGHARYHLARLFLDADDPERAVEILNEHFDKSINKTALDGEAAFFYAQALAEIPMPEYAIPRFRAFLQWFPDASERFRATAQQRIGELSNQQDSKLHELADRMKRTERDLRKPKTDKPVQVEQDAFVEILNELIEMYEERERQGSGPPSGNGPSSGPANQSKLPEGEARIGSLEKHRTVADRWGDMKDKEREKIASDVNKTLPPQYRKMLEQYYKKLGSGEPQSGGK